MRAHLKPHHLQPGRTKHTLVDSTGARPFPPFVTLEIAKFEGEEGFYLLYHPDTGPGTDTWHKSLEDALHQAEYEFEIMPNEWMQD